MMGSKYFATAPVTAQYCLCGGRILLDLKQPLNTFSSVNVMNVLEHFSEDLRSFFAGGSLRK